MVLTFPSIIEILGTLAFAISGIRLASAKRFDWFGAYVVGLITAIGGGTIRDLLLAHRDRMEHEYMMAKATADQIEARATATVEATVTVDFNQTIRQISSSQGLSPEDLAAVKLALADLRFAAEEKDEGGFAEKAKDALDLASKGAGLVPKVAKAIGTLAALLGA